MNPESSFQSQNAAGSTRRTRVIPLWLKIAYTVFMAILVPAYWIHYGPSNFLFFCDVALFVTLYAVWTESRHAASMAAVGILIPQLFWCLDFVSQSMARLFDIEFTGMTTYMFDENRSLFLRGLSLFHGWMPFLLVFLVIKLGYEKHALKTWTGTACGLCLISFFLLPPPGAKLLNPHAPTNINYVFGLSTEGPQGWMPGEVYLLAWLLTLFWLAFLPAHFVLKRFAVQAAAEKAPDKKPL